MEGIAIKKNRTWFYTAGFILILLSGIIFVSMIAYYNYTGFIKSVHISDVAQSVVTVSGLLASIAGLFFVLDSLQLQREALDKQTESIEHQRADIKLQREDIDLQIKEASITNAHLKDQSEIYRSQQVETTFFTLLENHKKIISTTRLANKTDYEGIDIFTNNVRNMTAYYLSNYNKKYFPRDDSTRDKPLYYVISEQTSINTYVKNIKFLISFIKHNFKNTKQYYDILDNYISLNEKYIIGLYINILNPEERHIFKTEEYNFIIDNEIDGVLLKNNIDLYIPSLTIFRHEKNLNKFTSDNLRFSDDTFFSIVIVKNVDLFNKELKIKGIKIYQEYKDKDRAMTIYENELDPVKEGNYHYIKLDHEIYKNTIRNRGFQTFHFDIEFIYNNKTFVVTYWATFDINFGAPILNDEHYILNYHFQNEN